MALHYSHNTLDKQMTVCAALNSICACHLKARSRRTQIQPTEGVDGSKALAIQPLLWRSEKWTALHVWSKRRRFQPVFPLVPKAALRGRGLFCFRAAGCLPDRSLVPAWQEEVVPHQNVSCFEKSLALLAFFMSTWKI